MFVKRFVAGSMPEATAQIRKELGQEVIILSSRKVRAKGLAGLFGKMVYEVVAAVEESQTHEVERPVAPAVTPPQAPATKVRASYHEASLPVPSIEPVEPPVGTVFEPAAKRRLLPSAAVNEPTAPAQRESVLVGDRKDEALLSLTDQLSSTGLSHSLLVRFVQKANAELSTHPEALQETLRAFARETLAVAGGLRLLTPRDRVVGLVGPTGVGKTTTIAKLAARARLKEGRRVGVLTIDSFRVAAIEQMKTYADILGLPFVAARDANEARAGLQALSQCDLILVDTTGRSFLSPEHAREMADALAPFPFDVKYLVLSLSSRLAEALSTAEVLQTVGYDALLLTKSDETLLPTLALSLVDALHIPLSYIATGQHVPDDIRVADPSFLSELVCKGGGRNG